MPGQVKNGQWSSGPRRGQSGLALSLVLVLVLAATCAGQGTTINVPAESTEAATKLIERFHGLIGTNPGLTGQEFRELMTNASGHSDKYVRVLLGPCNEEDKKDKDVNCTRDAQQCPGTEFILETFGSDDRLPQDKLIAALPVALNTLTTASCKAKVKEEEPEFTAREKKRPTLAQSWLYGLGFCSLVAIFISNIGAFLGPCMESRFFRRLLQFLVSMGAGSLATTGLLVLIPEAFDLMSVEELADAYVWKATCAILSIFTFFSSERLLKTFLISRKKKREGTSNNTDDENHMFTMTEGHNKSNPRNVKEQDADGHGHSSIVSSQNEEDRLTLAWMVMGGDVLHNFVDGLSVGAAFTESLGLGISVSLAIVCEELPHELADIAILLHSGISIKRAIIINFLSACSIYIGLVLGILIGSNIHAANLWIFAVAGGLFLYIPLVDMLPDMRSHLDQLLATGSPEAKTVAVLHFIGLLAGTAIIVFIVNISGYIDVE
ncbi:zinc transporter ZIP14 [Elysia marginata]|uniref:Zinc transporter ZIP14 n=1 Tax=Elysia marginata TaxID=1093978 RepID=A0AAV4FEI1_9GAST|nr:zinc transporter ZIP14 [Elysia marginata]